MAARQKDRYKLFKATPSVGGNLITRGSADNCGVFNYLIARDFRRDLDVEIRAEGYDYFAPNQDIPIGGQPFPSQIQLDSLSCTAGVVTATRSSGQWFAVGETVIITGATDPLYNGTFTVTAATGTTFQYSIVGAPVPETSTTLFAQAVEELNLLGFFRRPNGQRAVIAGSQRRLYRYYSLEDPDYISRDPADYPVGTPAAQLSYWSDGTLFPADAVDYPVGTPVIQQQYVDTAFGAWIVIGSGFSTLGRRWEVVSINGYMVFNNGVDLLCTYRVEDMNVVPIYELRDSGIASVGTISEIDGILVCGDITEIQADQISDWFNTAGRIHIDTLTRVGAVVTATIAAGNPFVVGESVDITGAVNADYNGTFIVTGATGTQFTYNIAGTPATPDGSISIYAIPSNGLAPYGIYPYTQYLDRTIFRVLWGTPGEPRRWGPIYRGAMTVGSNLIQLGHPVKGLTVGMNVTVVGAGTPHAGGTSDNLTGNILYVNSTSVLLDSFAETAGTFDVQATDMLGSIVGYEDLQDDGSAILKMLPLADQLVIYKDTCVFLAQYLGDVNQPFAFSPRRIQTEQSLFYRNTLWLVETPSEVFHIYAGRNSFYRLDLTNQQPMLLPHFESCSDLFYSQANLANTEKIFAAENGITHEILFVFPSILSDKMLRWDYKQDSIKTSTAVITAASTIRKPEAGLTSGAEEDWFIMGTADGVVVIYGKTDIPQSAWGNESEIFYRRATNPYSATRSAYTSTLRRGLGGFGNDYLEKDLRSLVELFASQSPNTTITLRIYGAQNANGPYTLLGTKVLSNPQETNLLPIYARRFYFFTELEISGVDNPCRMVGELWNIASVDSRSLPRG